MEKMYVDDANFTFNVMNLLTISRMNNCVDGPMDVFIFARCVMDEQNLKFDRLARITFPDPAIMQFKGKIRFSNYDHLIIGNDWKKSLDLQWWMDVGSGAILIGSCSSTDMICTIDPKFKPANFALHLTDAQIERVFKYIFENPECIAPTPVDDYIQEQLPIGSCFLYNEKKPDKASSIVRLEKISTRT